MSIDLSSVTDSNYVEGEMSLHDHPIDAIKLWGRTLEASQLLGAFQCVLHNKTFETVVVHGASGTGKTSLVNTLRENVIENNGFLCAGKFFQNCQLQESYCALSSAFSDLCDLIGQSRDFDDKRRNQIKTDLKEDGHILVQVISGLSQFLGDASVLSKSRMEGAFTMFKVACKTFLQAMTSPEHPVVLILDDIQWMDAESRILIKILLEDEELKNLLLVLIYRDEEQNRVSDLFQDQKQLGLDIGLKNLELAAVTKMVCSVLDVALTNEDAVDLSGLVYQRTHGNPFHILQFLDHIKHMDLLIIDPKTCRWIIDVDLIQHETVMSESLVDVLEAKIQRLPPNVQETLKLASLLGFCFKEAVLTQVVHAIRDTSIESVASRASIVPSLRIAVKEGFIERTKAAGEYRFLHDKLQSAFRSMVDNEVMTQMLHRTIGQTFLHREDVDSIYQSAVHLNSASELLETDEERVKLAQINLDASKYCADRSAFVTAATLLKDGLVLIPYDKKWSIYYRLTLEASQLLASMYLILGNFDDCQEMVNQVLDNAKSVEDKRPTLETIARIYIAKNEVNAANVAAKRALDILGIHMPSKINILHVVRKLLRVRRLLRGKSDQELLALPMLTDPTITTAVKVLADQSIGCLIAGYEDQMVYSALLALELSLTIGLSPYSPSAFAFYSVAELCVGNFKRAYRFGKLTLMMLDELRCEGTVGSSARLMVVTNILHYRNPLNELIPQMRNSMTLCSEAGDIVFYVYGAASLSWSLIYTGMSLAKIEIELRLMYPRLCDFEQDAMLRWFQPSFQFVLNFRSSPERWTELADLTGEVMCEDEYMRHSKDCSHNYFSILALVYKLQLAYHFGFFVLAESIVDQLKPIVNQSRSDLNYFTWHFFASLTYYEQYRRHGQGKYLRLARKHKRKLQHERKEFQKCCNSQPLCPLLDAEDLSVSTWKLRKQDETALAKAYDTAITALQDVGFANMEALANERAGFAFIKLRNQATAEKYFSRALHVNQKQWGATAKHDWLAETSERLISSIRTWRGYQGSGLVGNTISVRDFSLAMVPEESTSNKLSNVDAAPMIHCLVESPSTE